MKLCYHPINNFGDLLNPWLWDQLIPGVLNEDESTAFVGIGTLLNEKIYQRVPQAKRLVVFSTGAGYGKHLSEVDEAWTFYCVRGPLTAKTLGLSPDVAVTDGALLIRNVYQPSDRKTQKFAYMPHHTQSSCGNRTWPAICEAAGIGYIDARWPLHQVLDAISQTEVLLTEAMHGSIMAEALRVPWVPIVTNPRILSFKWQDWCASIGVDYQPHRLTLPVTWPEKLISIGLKEKPRDPRDSNFFADLPANAGIRTAARYWLKKQSVANQLKQIAKTARPVVTSDQLIEQLTQELNTRLERFRSDVAAGRFN